ASRSSQLAPVPMPSGDTIPTPVTTTRLGTLFLVLRVRLAVLDGFLHPGDFLGILVGHLDPELLLERHHQLDRVQRIGAKVVDERRVRRDFFLVHAQLLDDDALHFVRDRHQFLQCAFRLTSLISLLLLPCDSYMYMPPLTASTCPVIYDASSEARKQTAAAMSSGVPSRPSGMRSAQAACAPSARPRVMSVSIMPGATAFTVMPREATSRASAFVNPMSPAFDAA